MPGVETNLKNTRPRPPAQHREDQDETKTTKNQRI